MSFYNGIRVPHSVVSLFVCFRVLICVVFTTSIFLSYLSLDNFRIDGEWNLKVRKVNFFLNGNEGFCSIDSVWNFHNDQLHQVIKFLSFFWIFQRRS